jgi:transposase-like protein
MLQNVTKFEWNEKRLRAAQLVSEDRLTDEQIATELGVTRMTLARWKSHVEFQARKEQITTETKERLLARGVREKQNRLNALDERHRKMQEVIKQRAIVYADEASGGNTGLIVKQVKGIGKGADFQIVEMYAVDTGLLKELREHEKQAAMELGEWTERHEHSFDFSNLTDEEVVELERLRAKLNS